ncbi:MAG: hypothetical protein AB7S72_06350 [Draconibacterium sp.]
MRFIRKNTRLIFLLVLPVYLFIVQASVTNRHTHFYPNGMVVTHSHPFQHGENGNAAGHNHSKTEICFYAGLNSDFYHFTPVLQILQTESVVLSRALVFNEEPSFQNTLFQFGLRGPPALQIS